MVCRLMLFRSLFRQHHNARTFPLPGEGPSISPFPITGIFILGLFLYCLDKRPVGGAFIKLCSCPAMNSYRFYPGVRSISATSTIFLLSSSHPILVLTVTGSFTALTIADVIEIIRGIFLNIPCSRTPVGNFFNRTSEVDIDNIRFCFLCYQCSFDHCFCQMPVELDTYRSFEIINIKFPDTLFSIPYQTIRRNEFSA